MKLDLQLKIKEIKFQMLNGLSYDDAKVKFQPILDKANEIGEKIAKKHNIKYKKLTFSYVTR